MDTVASSSHNLPSELADHTSSEREILPEQPGTDNCTSDHLVQAVVPWDPALEKEFALDLPESWDEYEDLAFGLAQKHLLILDSVRFDGNSDHLGQAVMPGDRALENDLPLDLPEDEYEDLAFPFAQKYLLILDSFRLDDNGGRTVLKPWFSTFNGSLGLQSTHQTDDSLPCHTSSSHGADWYIPWENKMLDNSSNVADSSTPSNSCQPTTSLTESSTDIPLPTSPRPPELSIKFFFSPAPNEAAGMLSPQRSRYPPETPENVQTAVKALRTIIVEIFAKKIEQERRILKTETLAKSAGLTASKFHRLFKAMTRLNPVDFMMACRALGLQDGLCKLATERNRLNDCAAQVSPYWHCRNASNPLGGMSLEDYINGSITTKVSYCRITSPVGEFEIAYSKAKPTARLKVHAVFLVSPSGLITSDHFCTTERSDEHAASFRRFVDKLAKKSRERDPQLPADVLSILWRARM